MAEKIVVNWELGTPISTLLDHCKFSRHKFHTRIYRINHTETWNFNAPTVVTSVSHKITAKCGILCPKTLLLSKRQHAIHFIVATRNVCPLAIPKSCAQNMGLRLLENHSFVRLKQLLHTYRAWCLRSKEVTKQEGIEVGEKPNNVLAGFKKLAILHVLSFENDVTK